ncbi:esterase-like activity of phytase family protein [Pseudovibrio sp. SPO723]|uniref:esterase-like activity of phytase family protein n=1 Tax=Nesiotobacter zosterae TaxID=392721 RepID=UPI0029C31506|nr:esterase-like activity of phytase family protein [Pseudovibrio sp. SPO723]MDX5595520.1 esterase-like activity of phytase family protein [Pseudovibrio sp. SPO723]
MREFKRRLIGGISLAIIAATASAANAADGKFFERIATYPVFKTLAEGVDPATETVAEIISASKDGRTLVFTDSPGDALVFLDITDPANPVPAGRADLGGEPTSVSVAAKYALAGVNTSESYTAPSGYLAVVDLETKEVVAKCDASGQPDSVALSKDGKFVAIAIENERDEDLNDGVIPQLPAGHLTIFDLDADGMPTNCEAARTVEMTGLADVAPTDPEPEFVSINDDNLAVVTLQENNHLAIVDLASGEVVTHFSAGTSSADAIPVKKARMSDASGSITDVPREPDAVAWIDANRFVTANEGDYEGGSRGFTIWNKDGEVLFDSGAQMEHLGMSHGHYPSKRAHKKGTEPEGVAVGTFGDDTLIFVNSERGNFVAVYKDTGGEPEFVQFLPTHIAPEGLLALSENGLFVVANEKDEAEEGVRAHVGIYKFGADAAEYPQLISETDPKTGAPIGWGAISGMAGDPTDASKIYAVSDSFYDAARIFTLDVSEMPAKIVSHVDLTGGSAEKYDLEGIAIRKDGGFWLASEGHPGKELQHYLLQVTADGAIEQEITLPETLIEQAKRFSLEGVTEAEINGTPVVVVAVQREWNDDPKGMTKLGIYNPADKSWGFVHYPLDAPKSPAGGWVGLSEVTYLGDNRLAVVERDNKGGTDAAIKQVTVVSLDGVTPAAHGEELPVLEKKVVLDLLPQMSATNGWTPDKVEGLAITADGRILISTDNDGVDDASGESLFFDMGEVSKLN